MITITIKTDNAAFSDGDRDVEIARILRRLADDFADSSVLHNENLRDINGNTVGKVKITGR